MATRGSLAFFRNETASRRRFLAAIGTVSGVSTAGCSESFPSLDPEGEGDEIEILVENRTDELARIGVRIEDRHSEALFSRVYEVEAGHLDSTGGIDTRPATVSVIIPDSPSRTWEYAPDTDLQCDGKDIGITVKDDGVVESWYAC